MEGVVDEEVSDVTCESELGSSEKIDIVSAMDEVDDDIILHTSSGGIVYSIDAVDETQSIISANISYKSYDNAWQIFFKFS